MLVENADIDETYPRDWGSKVFRYCRFGGVDPEGLNFEGILTYCTLTGCRFYWGLFNCALLAEVRFVDCTFPGTSFRGTSFIACTFERCAFILDNMDGNCTLDNCTLTDCHFIDCTWETAPESERDITGTRFFGCTMSACRGLDGLF
jgi:uncharacterized protein YjbI with pentapeptide repeats